MSTDNRNQRILDARIRSIGGELVGPDDVESRDTNVLAVVETQRANRSYDIENLVNRCCHQVQSRCRNDLDHGQSGAVRGKPVGLP